VVHADVSLVDVKRGHREEHAIVLAMVVEGVVSIPLVTKGLAIVDIAQLMVVVDVAKSIAVLKAQLVDQGLVPLTEEVNVVNAKGVSKVPSLLLHFV
jgi:hypothetical protein